MKIKQTKGITLIALIITIIILLILAGVTITMLTGDNGILKQATNARETNTKAELEEQVKLAVMASKVNNTASINIETLEDEINKISGTTITKSEEDKLPWTVKKGNYEVTITEDGTITSKTTGKDDGKKDDDKKEEDTRTVLEQATAAKPEGSTIDPNTNENTGIVMIDSNGNEWEWTLEKNTNNYVPCNYRGGYFYSFGSSNPVSSSLNDNTSDSGVSIGLRFALY